jgi:hypothetical protein
VAGIHICSAKPSRGMLAPQVLHFTVGRSWEILGSAAPKLGGKRLEGNSDMPLVLPRVMRAQAQEHAGPGPNERTSLTEDVGRRDSHESSLAGPGREGRGREEEREPVLRDLMGRWVVASGGDEAHVLPRLLRSTVFTPRTSRF